MGQKNRRTIPHPFTLLLRPWRARQDRRRPRHLPISSHQGPAPTEGDRGGAVEVYRDLGLYGEDLGV